MMMAYSSLVVCCMLLRSSKPYQSTRWNPIQTKRLECNAMHLHINSFRQYKTRDDKCLLKVVLGRLIMNNKAPHLDVNLIRDN